jgi:phosphatidylglycerol:prolipoprotein diacylglycerol transferase
MMGPYVHRIDPVLADAGGVYLWWYGLSYSLGFLNIWWYLRRHRQGLGLSTRDVDALSVFFCGGVLLGGRLVEVAFDEWPFYRQHPGLIPALWLGGMATHGLLLGAGLGAWLFSRVYGKPFRALADALVVPGALLMGLGRIGNFIDGQIVGSVTDGWWGVQFPDADGFRHPVVLYDGLKNLLLVPYLAWVRRTNPTPGATAARFVFWYPFLRIFIDLFRDYPTHRLALGTGQTLNLAMALLGLVLLVRSRMRRLGRLRDASPRPEWSGPTLPAGWYRAAFVALLVVGLTIPSNWTQDIPARYGQRHPGLRHSIIYPRINTAAPAADRDRASPGSDRRRTARTAPTSGGTAAPPPGTRTG